MALYETLPNPGPDSQLNVSYRPNKQEREVRRMVWERYNFMKGDTLRVEAEQDWEDADSAFGQYIPTPDVDDWRAHIVLPDAFAAIEAQMQETIERNSRPYLRRVEDSDSNIETFQNAILTWNMNRTNFDFQYFLAKYSAAIRGTAYIMETYRLDKRHIQDPDSVDADGNIVYKDKVVTDVDDTFSEWIPNEFIFIDPNAKHIDEAVDMVRREVIDVDEFHRSYQYKKDFINIDKVRRGGDNFTSSFFQMPKDMNQNQVEILHYYNRARDMYYALANAVVIRMGPLPWKHKELPISVVYQYMVPGRMYGLGVPKVIKALSEERASIRNLNLDRQKMAINKMFLVNDSVDMDEEDLITRPHGFVPIALNGQSIRDIVLPLEYSDTPGSAFTTEEVLLEDIRRAHGIDDRIQGNATGGTATEAALLAQSSQKRINMVAKISEMDFIKRTGKLKWANIQFFYPTPRIEQITEDNEEKEKKTYRKVQADGKTFTIQQDEQGKKSLEVNEVEGSYTFKLDPSMARFMEGDYDVIVDVETINVVNKIIQQSKVTEMFTGLAAIPQFLAQLDPRKSVRRIIEANSEAPHEWMVADGKTDEEWMQEAEWENEVMKQGQMLSPTEGATEIHTLGHLQYTKTDQYKQLVAQNKGIEAIFMAHIMGEHEANPATGSVSDSIAALGGAGGATPGGGSAGPGGLQAPGIPAPALGGGPGAAPAPNTGPQQQNADIQPSTVVGEQPNR